MRARTFALGLGASPARADDAPGAWNAPAFTRLDSLFIAAATGEPRFQAVRDSSEKALLALGDSTLRYLAACRLTGQTPRQAHYVERLFTVLSDSGRNASPRRVLEQALQTAPDTVRAQLLYIGSALGDTLFREIAIEWLNNSGSVLVRRMALRSLGQYRKPTDPPALVALLPFTSGLERHQVLWALEKHPPLGDARALIPYLEDPAFYNRRKARDLLLRAADSAWAKLEPLFPVVMEMGLRREAWALAREAKGGEAYLRRQAALMTREEKVFFGVKN